MFLEAMQHQEKYGTRFSRLEKNKEGLCYVFRE